MQRQQQVGDVEAGRERVKGAGEVDGGLGACHRVGRRFPTSRADTIITPRKIPTAGITTWAVTSAWDSAVTRISTALARDGCHEATSSWTSRAGTIVGAGLPGRCTW